MERHPPLFLANSNRILPGARRVYPIPQPAAGVQWSMKVPAGRLWRIITGAITLTLDAVVANRNPSLQLTVADQVVWRGNQSGPFVAGNTVNVSIVGTSTPTGTTGAGVPDMTVFPDTWLPEGSIIASLVTGMDAGDQWSAGALFLQEVYFDDAELKEILDDVEHAYHKLASGG